MNKHLIIFLSIITLSFVFIVGWKYTKPLLDERLQKKSSDASSTLATLHIGTDNWIGYFPLCSPGMHKNLRLAGYQLRCEDDQADYSTRFRRLRRGELQFAAATVDSYLLNGQQEDYPGTIIMVLDESKGGDALIAKKEVFSSLDALKGEQLKKGGQQIAFTPNSPSEHLLKGISRDFGLPLFTEQDSGHWMVKTDGSEKALNALRQGKVAAAALWEPDVSRALALPDMVKLIGTEDTDRLIVDVLLVERSYSVNRPEAVRALLQAYFTTLEEYRHDPKSLVRDIQHASGLDEKQIHTMLEGVAWANLADNHGIWFSAGQPGIGAAEGIVDAIHLALKIFHYSKDLQGNPLPGGDPYRITNRSFIEALAQEQAIQGTQNTTGSRFRALSEGQWDTLKKVGTLKVDPIPFRPSTNTLDEAGRSILNDIAATLHRYPRYRILVEGHTGLSGDPEANRQLSEQRAQAVADHLIQLAKVDPNRIRAKGFGASQPLPRLPNEADRAYSYRLSRVDLSLLSD
jgi:outer membrane protein OmpA-like peptidoglycan-associated protein